jgi:hypothetical protein
MQSQNKRDKQSVDYIATGFVQTMYFDLQFNYIGGNVEVTSIVPDAPDNWESESCKLIPYVRYEYTQVSKKNPETSRSAMTRINQARKKVRLFASVAENKGTVLRIVKNTIVAKLQPRVEAIYEVTSYYTEESYGSLNSDPIASERKIREFPPDVKEKRKAASKKNEAKPNGRRAK